MSVRAADDVLRKALLGWAAENRRDLPWRRTRDPWAVLVSELMLQQTQVSRVEPRFAPFLARFPTPAACAAAGVGDVVRAWAGLGYNRRAVNLHRAAEEVVHRFGGSVPRQLRDLRSLPGVGAYTARAVLAFAFEADVGVVETNSARVLARAVAGRALTPSETQSTADRLVPPGGGWAWNQALLDLGATRCRRARPACDNCPLAGECAWMAAGRPAPDPADQRWAARAQPPFAGSDRQGRGRLVEALRQGPLSATELAPAAGWPDAPERAARAAAALVAEGLARRNGEMLELP